MQEKPIINNKKQIEYTLGTKLERHRIKKKWSVENVAKKICVSEKYINAIEQGKIDELPERPYTIGFIKAYCEILGINNAPLIEEFKQFTIYNDFDKPKYKSYKIENKFKNKKKNIYIIIFILIAITTWILINAVIEVSSDSSNKEYKQINQLQNNNSEIIENNIINNNELIETKSKKTNDIIINNEPETSEPNVIEQKIEKTIFLNNLSTKKEKSDQEEIVTIRPLKQEEIEKEKLNQIKITAIKDTKITIFKPNGEIYFKGTLKKRRYKSIPINKGYYITSNNGGLVAISIKNSYENKIIGELDIVLNKLILNSNNLRKHFK